MIRLRGVPAWPNVAPDVGVAGRSVDFARDFFVISLVVRIKAFICDRCKARQLSELPQAPGLKELVRTRSHRLDF